MPDGEQFAPERARESGPPRSDRKSLVVDDDLLEQAREFIEESVADSELDPAEVADHLHLSLRTLDRLFHEHGRSVSASIRARRLEHARCDLNDPALRHLSVCAIGSRWGLSDPTHFARTFRAAYGVTPAAYRTMALRRSASAPGRIDTGEEPAPPGTGDRTVR